MLVSPHDVFTPEIVQRPFGPGGSSRHSGQVARSMNAGICAKDGSRFWASGVRARLESGRNAAWLVKILARS